MCVDVNTYYSQFRYAELELTTPLPTPMSQIDPIVTPILVPVTVALVMIDSIASPHPDPTGPPVNF